MVAFIVLCVVASALFWSAAAWANGRPGWYRKQVDATKAALLFTALLIAAVLIAALD